MDTFLKILTVILSGCAAALLLREGEFRRLSALACCCAAALLALQLLEPIWDLLQQLTELSNVQSAVFAPVWKATAIGILTEIAGAYCKDAGEHSLASVLELGGVLSILYVALPLFTAVLSMLQTLMGD